MKQMTQLQRVCLICSRAVPTQAITPLLTATPWGSLRQVKFLYHMAYWSQKIILVPLALSSS